MRWLLPSQTLPSVVRLIHCNLIQTSGSVSTTSLAFLRYELVMYLCVCTHLPILCSMLIMRNKLSRLRKNLLFTLVSRPLKLCIVHGRPDRCAWSMHHSTRPSKLEFPRLRSTMRRSLITGHTLFPCVSVLLYSFATYSRSLLVLNPEEKTTHFKKHWSKDLQKEVRKVAEDIVSFHWLVMWSYVFELIVLVQGAMVQDIRYWRGKPWSTTW